jgi:hypothetical protein
VSENGGELEDFLVLTIELNGRLVWWSGVSLLGGVVSICLLDSRIGSVGLDGLKTPNWLSSGSEAKKASDSE